MKAKILISKSLNRLVSFFTINRNGDAIDHQKWDDMYESVLFGRMNKHHAQK